MLRRAPSRANRFEPSSELFSVPEEYVCESEVTVLRGGN